MQNTSSDNDFFKKLGRYYEVAGAILITIVILIFFAYTITSIGSKSADNYTSLVTLDKAQLSNGFPKAPLDKRYSDSVLSELYLQNIILNDSIKVINATIRQNSLENSYTEDRIKMFASIVGLIIAIVGFFGFKSLNDIREHTIKNSQIEVKIVAEKIAKSTAEEILTDEYVSDKFDDSFNEVKKLYEGGNDSIIKQINILQDRVLKLEQIADLSKEETGEATNEDSSNEKNEKKKNDTNVKDDDSLPPVENSDQLFEDNQGNFDNEDNNGTEEDGNMKDDRDNNDEEK